MDRKSRNFKDAWLSFKHQKSLKQQPQHNLNAQNISTLSSRANRIVEVLSCAIMSLESSSAERHLRKLYSHRDLFENISCSRFTQKFNKLFLEKNLKGLLTIQTIRSVLLSLSKISLTHSSTILITLRNFTIQKNLSISA